MTKKSPAQRESERRARKSAAEAKARERARLKSQRDAERARKKLAAEAKARARKAAAEAKKNHHTVNHRTDPQKAITRAKRKSNIASGQTKG